MKLFGAASCVAIYHILVQRCTTILYKNFNKTAKGTCFRKCLTWNVFIITRQSTVHKIMRPMRRPQIAVYKDYKE